MSGPGNQPTSLNGAGDMNRQEVSLTQARTHTDWGGLGQSRLRLVSPETLGLTAGKANTEQLGEDTWPGPGLPLQ